MEIAIPAHAPSKAAAPRAEDDAAARAREEQQAETIGALMREVRNLRGQMEQMGESIKVIQTNSPERRQQPLAQAPPLALEGAASPSPSKQQAAPQTPSRLTPRSEVDDYSPFPDPSPVPSLPMPTTTVAAGSPTGIHSSTAPPVMSEAEVSTVLPLPMLNTPHRGSPGSVGSGSSWGELGSAPGSSRPPTATSHEPQRRQHEEAEAQAELEHKGHNTPGSTAAASMVSSFLAAEYEAVAHDEAVAEATVESFMADDEAASTIESIESTSTSRTTQVQAHGHGQYGHGDEGHTETGSGGEDSSIPLFLQPSQSHDASPPARRPSMFDTSHQEEWEKKALQETADDPNIPSFLQAHPHSSVALGETHPHSPEALGETADDPNIPSFLQAHPHSQSQSESHQYDTTESAMESAPNSPPQRAAPAPPQPQRMLSEQLATAVTTAAPEEEEAAAAAAAEAEAEAARAARWSIVLKWLQDAPGMGSAIQTMFTNLDVDNSGSVDIGEFIRGLKSLGESCHSGS